jgi:5-methylcytosine-specific restriction endonuclease McrA
MASNELRMPFAEWLYRMSEARVPSTARTLAVCTAVFNVSGNDKLAWLSGLDMAGRADKTYAGWKRYLLSNGWLISTTCKGTRGRRAALSPAFQGRPVVLVEMPHDYTPVTPSVAPEPTKVRRHCSAALRKRVREAFDYTCQNCGFRCEPGQSLVRKGHAVDVSHLTVDRLVPGAQGGEYTPDNVTLVCRDCNSKRRDRLEAVGVSLATVEARQCR